MMKLKLSSLVLVSSLMASAAAAQDLPDVRGVCAPEVSLRRASIEHVGERGLWFHLDVARCMAGRLAALPLYYDRVQLLERRIQLAEERHDLLIEALAVSDRIEERYQAALSAATRRANAAEGELGVWYRSPALWAVVGAVVAGALVFVAGLALRAAVP